MDMQLYNYTNFISLNEPKETIFKNLNNTYDYNNK